MSSAAMNLQSSKVRLTLTITGGPNRGARLFKSFHQRWLSAETVCDITLQDAKCSRQQAVIHVNHDRISIEDLSSKRTTLVNSKNIESIELKHGDKIEMGDTEFLFRAEIVPMQPPGQNLQIIKSNSPTSRSDLMPSAPKMPGGFPTRPQTRPPSDASGKVTFYIIAVVILGALVYFLSTASGPKISEATTRNQDRIDAEIKRAEAQAAEDVAMKKLNSLDAKAHYEQGAKKFMMGNEKFSKMDFQGATRDFEDAIGLFTEYFGSKRYNSAKEQSSHAEAQKFYLEGFRYYSQRQYTRALESFNSALQNDSTHKLAGIYVELATRSREEAIAEQLELGKQYQQKQMYARCSASLEKVLVEIRNESDIRYKEANTLKRVCDSYMRKDD